MGGVVDPGEPIPDGAHYLGDGLWVTNDGDPERDGEGAWQIALRVPNARPVYLDQDTYAALRLYARRVWPENENR